MVLSVVGVVLFVTLFGNVMTAFDNLLLVAGIADFIAFEITVQIAPTVLMLAGVGGAAFAYYKGYKAVAGGSDPSGMIRMVFGILVIILFVTLFETIATAFVTLLALYVGSDYIAFDTVLTILPTVLFLGGIFAGIGTAVGGNRARKSRKVLAAY
jgi:hypothetical protein